MKHLKKQRVPIVIEIVFTKNATDALVKQAIYIFEQTDNADKADMFLDTMKAYIISSLTDFPKLGRSAEEFGEGIRKLIYQRYSILYRIQGNQIQILTIYRENLPNF